MANKEKITLPGAETGLCYSPAIRCGTTLYVSGQVGADAQGNIPPDIESQTALAIENAKALIEQAGGKLENVLMCRCFLQKAEDFAGMNAAYAKYFGKEGDIAPARYTVLAPPVDARYLVEIAMVAAL